MFKFIKYNKKLLTIIPIIMIFASFSIVNYIDLDSDESKSENRKLAQKPNIYDLKDKTYFSDFDNYYTDQFIGREKLLKIYTNYLIKSRKTYVRDYHITVDNWILEKHKSYSQEKDIKDVAKIINDFSNKTNKKVFYFSLPHKSNILSHLYPRYETNNKNNKISFFIDNLDESKINIIDTSQYFKENFSEEELEKFYFKTDHHWNAIGSFESFKYMINTFLESENIKINNDIWDNYKTSFIRDIDFLGSYNRNLYGLVDKNEDIPFVHSKLSTNYKIYKYENKELKEQDIKSVWSTDTYKNLNEITYGGSYVWDIGYYKVINENALIDKKIIIFRDSYQGAMAWLFADLFKEIEVVDSRNIQKETGFKSDYILKNSNADYMFMMYNDLSFDQTIPTLID